MKMILIFLLLNFKYKKVTIKVQKERKRREKLIYIFKKKIIYKAIECKRGHKGGIRGIFVGEFLVLFVVQSIFFVSERD